MDTCTGMSGPNDNGSPRTRCQNPERSGDLAIGTVRQQRPSAWTASYSSPDQALVVRPRPLTTTFSLGFMAVAEPQDARHWARPAARGRAGTASASLAHGQQPDAIGRQQQPPIRAIQTPSGNSFSISTTAARTATHRRFITPTDEQQRHQDPAAAEAVEAMREAHAQGAGGAIPPVVDDEIGTATGRPPGRPA